MRLNCEPETHSRGLASFLPPLFPSFMSGYPYSNGTNGHVPSSNGASADPAPDGPSEQIRRLLSAFWKHKWIFLVIVAVFAGGSYYYTTTLPRSYQTSTLLLVTKDSGPASSLQVRSSSSSFGGRLERRSLANEMLVLQQSKTIAQRVAERLVEMDTHPQTGAPLQIIRNANGRVLPPSRVSGQISRSMFSRIEGEDVDAFRIFGRSNVPSEAALIANTYAEEYIEWTKEKSRESMAGSRSFLEAQEEKLLDEIEESEDEIKAFMNREDAVALDQESTRLVNQIADLEVNRDELQIQLDMMQSRLDADLQSLRQIEPNLADQLSSTLRAQLETIQERQATIEVRIEQIEDNNPGLSPNDGTALGREFAKLQAQSQTLRARADSIASDFVAQAQTASGLPPSISGPDAISRLYDLRQRVAKQQIEVGGVQAQIRTLERRVEEYRRELQKIPEQSFELAQLEREKRLAEGMYNFVRQRLQETRMNEEAELGYAEVLSPAGIPGVPITPDVDRIVILGLLFGMLLGGGVVLLLEKIDTRIRRPEDLKRRGLSILGAIPSMESQVEKDFGGKSRITIDGTSMSTALTMLLSPMSASAEAYRRIRSNLQFARPDKTIRVISVTSAGKGEGKTTTSMNLALAMASADKNTLIVDADLRLPRLHEIIDLSERPRLSNLLFDEVEFDPDHYATGIDNLSVLPASTGIPNPAEVLGSERMASFVEVLRDHYDFVIFDTAPLLLFSDSISLSRRCDGTILVAATGETDVRALDHAVSILKDVGVDLLGCILNRYDANTIEYGYGYGYAYSYRRLDEYYDQRDDAAPSGVTDRVRSWFSR